MTINQRGRLFVFLIILCLGKRVLARVIENDIQLLFRNNDHADQVIELVSDSNDTQLSYIDIDYEDQVVKFMDRVEFHGYRAEEHKMKSEDGYHLVLHRISGALKDPPSKGKRVVYVQHGLLMSTDQFVINGPGKDFVYLLVDAGYDVWLGNSRGNSYSKFHDFHSPESPSFWNYSYHEAAVYDVKVFVDYILNVTEQEKFVYVGFSLGTAIGYTFFSSLPEYNEKVDLIVSLGTVALWHNNNDVRCVLFRNIMKYVEKYNHYINIHEYLPSPMFLNRLTVNACESENFFKRQICKLLFGIMIPKMDMKRMPTGSLRTLLKTFPSGTSAKTLLHLGQNLRSGDFRKYDYGKSNIDRYETETPPKYPLYKVTAPVAIYYGLQDFFGNIDDLRDLTQLLPNVIVFQQIDDENCSHFDVVLNAKAKEVLFDMFIKLISTVRS